MRRNPAYFVFLGLALGAAYGCNALIGLDPAETTGDGCIPGDSRECFEGPEGAKDVGICRAGLQVCENDGAWGQCLGQVVPSEEDCATALDEDCDGKAADDAEAGCACLPLELELCYMGPPAKAGVGACAQGTRACDTSGKSLGECLGSVLPSIQRCFLPATDDDCDGIAGCTGEPLASANFGSTVDISDVGADIAVGPSGEILVTGRFTGGILDFGAGEMVGKNAYGAFVAKLDASLKGVWSKSMLPEIEPQEAAGTAVAVDLNGAVVVGGRFSKTIDFGVGLESDTVPGDNGFLAKYGPGGVFIWRSVLDGAGPLALRGIAVAADGSTTFAGGFTTSLRDEAGHKLQSTGNAKNAFVGKVDALGKSVFLRGFGDGAEQSAASVVVGADGSIFVAGEFAGSADFGLGTLTSAGGADVFVLKLDAMGNPLASKRFGGVEDERATALALDPLGNLILVGEMGPSGASLDFGSGPVVATSARDGFVASLSPSFGAIYAKLLPKFFPEDVAVDALGNAVLVGTARDATDLGGGPLVSFPLEDIIVLKLDAKGNHVHSAMYGSAASDKGSGVALGQFGEIFATGSIGQSMNFGVGAQLDVGAADDIFVAKFAP